MRVSMTLSKKENTAGVLEHRGTGGAWHKIKGRNWVA